MGKEETEGGVAAPPHSDVGAASRRVPTDYGPLICYALRQISGDSYDKYEGKKINSCHVVMC